MTSISKYLAQKLRRNGLIAWGVATDRRLSWAVRAPTVLALAYVASPIDFVPDFLPGFGWLDDVVVLTLAVAVTLRLVPKELIAEHTARAKVNPPSIFEEMDREAIESDLLSWVLILAGILLAVVALVAAGIDLLGAGSGLDAP
jgi:uncharacterized membrane protein YkvA (DUF1232 family)